MHIEIWVPNKFELLLHCRTDWFRRRWTCRVLTSSCRSDAKIFLDSLRFRLLGYNLVPHPCLLVIDKLCSFPMGRWAKVPDFLARTRADILAVTVGNVHGRYAKADPRLDLARLRLVKAAAAGASDSPLVGSAVDRSVGPGTLLAIHGASGLPDSQVQASISLGVCKFNVNTEVRTAAVDYLVGLGRASAPQASGTRAGVKVDLLAVLDESVAVMSSVIEQKMLEFDPKE